MTERTADDSREPVGDRPAVPDPDATRDVPAPAPGTAESPAPTAADPASRPVGPDPGTRDPTAGPGAAPGAADRGDADREQTVRIDRAAAGVPGPSPDGHTVRLPGPGAPPPAPTAFFTGPTPPVPGGPPPGSGGWPGGPYPQQPWPSYGPTPSGPPLPRPRGRANTALVVFGVLAALIITGGLWALIMLTGGTSPFTRDEPTAAAPAPATDVPGLPGTPASPFPAPGSSAVPVPSGGPTGQVTVTWTLFDVTYTATLNTSGPTGTADVSYQSPIAGEGTVQVQQDLTLRTAGGRLAYVGSNPRDAGTGQPTDNYTPDVFVLDVDADRQVFVVQVCDLRGSCAPAAR